MLPLLIHEFVSPFIYVCLDESVCTALLLEKRRQRTEYLPDFSVDVPENRHYPTSSIRAVSCRDETSPGGYFAFPLKV